MKISTEIQSAAGRIGAEKTIEYVAQAGFDAWDFSMFPMCAYDWNASRIGYSDHPLAGRDYLRYAKRLRQIGSDCGIVCNQSHAPFPSAADGMFPYLQRAIECTAEAGGKICVIHPDNDKTPEENAEMYKKLLPLAKDCGVKIATENMWNWDAQRDMPAVAACSTTENYLAHLLAVDDPDFVACLDIGHAEMKGAGSGAAAMVHGLGGYLRALHLHDNDRKYDNHQLPMTMAIDFTEIMQALKETGYRGYYTLEADRYLDRYADDEILTGLTKMAEAVTRLTELC